MALVTTFDELNEAQFKTYADGLMGNTRTHQKRKEFISYLHSVNAKDKKEIETERSSVILKLLELQKREKYIGTLSVGHGFDYAKTDYLFTSDDLTDAELETLVTEENTTVYVHGKTYTGNIHITADYVTLDGQSNKKSAISEELANSASFVGGVTISADNCILKGIDFTSTGVSKGIQFTNSATNVVLQDCKFIADTAVSDTSFWYGENYGTGNITIKNCRIQGYSSWYLMDGHTTSAVPTIPLHTVLIEDCLFKNNQGSIAIRGVTDNMNKKVSYLRNKFETTTLHASFWDFVEANNTRRVICKDNTFTAPVGQELLDGKKGVLQTWSKSKLPWTVEYSGNVISNIKFGIKVPLITSFYAPDTSSDNYKIDLSSSHTNILAGASFLYKRNSGTTPSNLKYHDISPPNDYTPVNISTYPSITVTNPNNLAIVE